MGVGGRGHPVAHDRQRPTIVGQHFDGVLVAPPASAPVGYGSNRAEVDLGAGDLFRRDRGLGVAVPGPRHTGATGFAVPTAARDGGAAVGARGWTRRHLVESVPAGGHVSVLGLKALASSISRYRSGSDEASLASDR